jgi:EpsD family peptidyl-prolyl cis-trans isomerase
MMERKVSARNEAEQAGLSNMLFPLVLAMSGCLVCCNKAQPDDRHHVADPVLAIVGGDEIKLSAVNAELNTLDVGEAGSASEQHQRQTLEALIDRDILARDAMRHGVDRDPAVVDAIAREKAKILVKAYLQELIDATPKPMQQEIDHYYKDHPFLYAERKLFKYDELNIQDTVARQQVRTMSDAGNSMRQILFWLDERNVPYELKQHVVTSDKLPSGIAEMTGNLANGKPFIVKIEDDFHIWTMTELSLQPLDEDSVTQLIEHALINQKARNELAANVAKLRIADGVVYSDLFRGSPHDTPLAVNDGRTTGGTGQPAHSSGGMRK